MHYQLEAAGIHQSEFEENIGLGFMRVSKGLESTSRHTSHRNSISETETYGTESGNGDDEQMKKPQRRKSTSESDDNTGG